MTIAIEEKTKSYKSILKITGGVLVSIGYFYFLLSFPTSAQAPSIKVLAPTVVVKQQASFKKLVSMQYQKPLNVQIPSIKVNSNVEQVSVNESGDMQVPKNFNNIGWLVSSSKIGEPGNLVLSGHFDTNIGAPAVFYNLNSIKKSDIILVQSADDAGKMREKTYIVTDKYMADPGNVEHIFEAYKKTSEPTITLITCNGIWDYTKQEYSNRLVVKGKLVN